MVQNLAAFDGDQMSPESAVDGVHHRLVDTIGGGFAVVSRYDVSANLIFKWRHDPRYQPMEDDAGALSFLPVEVVRELASARPSRRSHGSFAQRI